MDPLPSCPHCQTSTKPYRWGHSRGEQRYRCRTCGRTFGALTGTPTARLRKRSRWHQYLDARDVGYSLRRTAKACRVAVSTVQRWNQRLDPVVAVKIVGIPPSVRGLQRSDYATEVANDDRAQNACGYRICDLFAGIGGLRLPFTEMGAECVFTSEIDKPARVTYAANFAADDHEFSGDITKVDAAAIPDFDILLAGFPCQPFSAAGVTARNALGRAHGLACETHGTMFYEVVRVLAAKRPKAFLLENVRNLATHDGGRTFRTIRETLEVELGYDVRYRIIDASRFVPQRRPRLFMVGTRERTDFSFDDIMVPSSVPTVGTVFECRDTGRYGLTPTVWGQLQRIRAKHQARGNGFGYSLLRPDTPMSPTLIARNQPGNGNEILVDRGEGQLPRMLSPREVARLQGFPDSFVLPAEVSDRQLWRQLGNSVCVPVVRAIARCLIAALERLAMQAVAA